MSSDLLLERTLFLLSLRGKRYLSNPDKSTL